jgi:phosphoglycerate kinase
MLQPNAQMFLLFPILTYSLTVKGALGAMRQQAPLSTSPSMQQVEDIEQLAKRVPLKVDACVIICGHLLALYINLHIKRYAARTNQGKRVLVRADLNVPLSKEAPYVVQNDKRIREVLPTVRFLQGEGAKIILCSHLGRPKGKIVDSMSMQPVAAYFKDMMGESTKVVSTSDILGDDAATSVASLEEGQILILENLRFEPGEEKNEPGMAERLGSYADVYVNDAFGAAHRAHASTEGVTRHVSESVAGLLMKKELAFLGGVIESPERPLAAVIGGAKVSSKLPVLEALLEKCDKILIGGGMVFTFSKAMGMDVGASVVEEDMVDMARDLMKTAEAKGVKLILPSDIIVAEKFDAEAAFKTVDGAKEGIPEVGLALLFVCFFLRDPGGSMPVIIQKHMYAGSRFPPLV